jgi:hypothetical protein
MIFNDSKFKLNLKKKTVTSIELEHQNAIISKNIYLFSYLNKLNDQKKY